MCTHCSASIPSNWRHGRSATWGFSPYRVNLTSRLRRLIGSRRYESDQLALILSRSDFVLMWQRSALGLDIGEHLDEVFSLQRMQPAQAVDHRHFSARH